MFCWSLALTGCWGRSPDTEPRLGPSFRVETRVTETQPPPAASVASGAGSRMVDQLMAGNSSDADQHWRQSWVLSVISLCTDPVTVFAQCAYYLTLYDTICYCCVHPDSALWSVSRGCPLPTELRWTRGSGEARGQ